MSQEKFSDDIKLRGEYTIRVVGADGKEKSRHVIKNLIPAAIRTLILENMFDETPATTCLVSHVAVGSGTNAPADGNTQLQTEVARVAVTSRAFSGSIGTCSAVFPAGSATGTHREVGIFFEGTGAANSGTLGSRSAINITVTALDALFVDWRLTLADA